MNERVVSYTLKAQFDVMAKVEDDGKETRGGKPFTYEDHAATFSYSTIFLLTEELISGLYATDLGLGDRGAREMTKQLIDFVTHINLLGTEQEAYPS